MVKHGKKIAGTVAAVSVLAFGGAALAQSGSSPAKPAVQPAAESTSGPDLDNIQSGDQTTPDAPSVRGVSTSSAGESPGAPEAPGETGSEVAGNDGPGGHADEPGNPNADHQFNGVE